MDTTYLAYAHWSNTLELMIHSDTNMSRVLCAQPACENNDIIGCWWLFFFVHTTLRRVVVDLLASTSPLSQLIVILQLTNWLQWPALLRLDSWLLQWPWLVSFFMTLEPSPRVFFSSCYLIFFFTLTFPNDINKGFKRENIPQSEVTNSAFTRRYEYFESLGTKIEAWLYIPKGTPNPPVVILAPVCIAYISCTTFYLKYFLY